MICNPRYDREKDRTMTRRLNRLLPPLLAFACGAAAMLLFLSPAHADPVIAVTPTGLELSWQAWLAVALAGAGGALKILDVLLAGLKRLAPMTATTLDDRARDKLQVVDDTAHRKLDDILRVVGALVPATGVPAAASDRPAGTSGTAAMLIILLLGVAIAPAVAGCGGSQASRSATISSVDSGLLAAVAALRKYEHDQAEVIISGAKTLDEGKASLAVLRARTTTAWRAVDAALATLDVANTVNDDPSITGARRAVNDALTVIVTLTGAAL
jgi:hypothetical protein